MEEPPTLPRSSYLVRHWRGELPLGQALAVNTYAVNLVLRVLTAVATRFWTDSLPYTVLFSLLILMWIGVLALLTWQFVGIARTQNRRRAQTASPATYVFVWIVICASAGGSAFSFVVTGVPQITDYINIMRGDPQQPDPVLTVLPGGREIEFSGTVKFGTARRFEQFLGQHPGPRVLQIESYGGREREAREIADIVRAHRMDTYVGTHCESAGVVLFMAGVNREMKRMARIGFHSARAPGIANAVIADKGVDFLTKAGVDAGFTAHVIRTPPESMWYPSPEELKKQGIVTRISEGEGHSLGTRQLAMYTFEGLKKELATVPTMRALSLREPVRYDDALRQAVASIARGVDMKTSLREVLQVQRKALIAAIPCASDEALDADLDLWMQTVARNMYRYPRETLLFLKEGKLKHAVLDYPQEADTRFIRALLESPTLPQIAAGPALSATQVAEFLRRYLADKDALTLVDRIPETHADQIAACEGINDCLAAIRAMPADLRHAYIRRVLLPQKAYAPAPAAPTPPLREMRGSLEARPTTPITR